MTGLWPPRSWQDKQGVEYWQLNEVSTNLDFLLRPPLCVLNQSSSIPVPDKGFWQCPNWDVIDYDSDNMSDGGTRIVINTPGMYYVRFRTDWHPNGLGMTVNRDHCAFNAVMAMNRGGSFQWGASGLLAADVNGYEIDDAGNGMPNTGYGFRNTCAARVRLKEGDYIETFVAHSGGGSDSGNITAGGFSTSKAASFSARWLSA